MDIISLLYSLSFNIVNCVLILFQEDIVLSVILILGFNIIPAFQNTSREESTTIFWTDPHFRGIIYLTYISNKHDSYLISMFVV